MRNIVGKQQKLIPIPHDHPHASELAEISKILDDNPEVYGLVHKDLIAGLKNPETGREGMSAEQVIRTLVVYQMNEYSYQELEFHIIDSACYRAFCRLGFDDEPSKETLQQNIKKIKAATLEAFNRMIIKEAERRGIELGRKVRTDCTVEATNIHAPSDSTLLFDVVRVLARIMGQAREAGFDIEFTNHTKRAKRRMLDIQHAMRKAKRLKPYRELVKLTEKTIGYAVVAITELEDSPAYLGMDGILLGMILTLDLEHFIPLGRQVVEQTKRRVFNNEKVPANEKLVSIFEPHTDIIKKERRETLFGHKLCLTSGSSGLFLDCQILEGNPSDTTLAVEAIERQRDIFGRAPRQASFDGGFNSIANLDAIKDLGVRDVMFHKKRGLEIHEMVKSSWVYNRLKRFRAGIEGGISFLKRCFGLRRCKWSGLESFKAYTWASIVSANLLMLARHALA